MEAIDIDGLDFQQLEEFRTRCEQGATEMRETEVPRRYVSCGPCKLLRSG
jgi:hypothetical protein